LWSWAWARYASPAANHWFATTFCHWSSRWANSPASTNWCITSNGSQLHRLAAPLREAGVKRINISLDSLQPRRFRQLTRHGNLDQVIAGIDAAIAAQFERIRLNAVILKGRNEDEVLDLVDFALQRGIDIAFIEEMPLGLIDEHDRALSFCSSEELRAIIAQKYTLETLGDPSGQAGPARYFRTGFRPDAHRFYLTAQPQFLPPLQPRARHRRGTPAVVPGQ
jgi:cyclic pyranopterin phosphate synthase